MCKGIVKRHQAILTHPEKSVRNLAGKTVEVNLETATEIKGYGIRVEVTPKELPGAQPSTLFSHFLTVRDPEAKQILRLA